MRQYTWDEYYEKFYDWAESTQVRNLSALTSLGAADEVGEIIIELQVNVPAANRLLRKAVEAKLAFSGSDLVEFACINDKALATAAVRNSAERLTAEDMGYLYGEIEDEVIIEICKQRNILLPEDLREEEEYEYEDEEPEEIEEEPLEKVDVYIDDFVPEPRTPKLGFFGTLAAILQVQLPEHPLIKAEGTMDGVTATVRIVRPIMATDTADGIMGMTMYTAVSSAVTKAVAAGIDGGRLCLERKRRHLSLYMTLPRR